MASRKRAKKTARRVPSKKNAGRPKQKPAQARKQTTYRDAGVDIEAGDALVDRIGPLAKATRRPEVLAGVGGFSALCRIPAGYREPVLVSSTDGVGTKLKLAFLADRHDTIGIDLVAMVVNDLVTVGAEPLFLLDYFATGKLSVDQAESVIKGIAEGCKQAGCALVGGETAEMPGFYPKGEYDVAGFGVGVVEREKILDGTKARAGDALVAFASSGIHSNGYSLVRRVLIPDDEKKAKKELARTVPAFGSRTIGDVLLTPTRIYAKLTRALLATTDVHGLAHITGGGIPGNLPRVFPETLRARVKSDWAKPAVFEWIQIAGNVPTDEMFRTFNMGVGLIGIVPPADVDKAVRAAAGEGIEAWPCGELVARNTGESDCELVP